MKNESFKKILKVTRAVIDKRLDRALISLLGDDEKGPTAVPSRADLTRQIKEGLIMVNGRVVKPHYLLKAGDTIEMPPTHPVITRKSSPSKSAVSLPEVLFENADFAVLNKPAHLLVHPAQNSLEETLADRFVKLWPAAKKIGGDPLRPGVVHRLDRETSGLILFAKTEKGYLALKKLFQRKTIQKTYLALIYGHLSQLSGEIAAPLTRRSGKLKHVTAKSQKESARARFALTGYQVLKRYPEYDLVAAFPKTGRTHQIRVHFASLGHPLVGDKLYAFRSHKRASKERGLFPDRHMLHAWYLHFSYNEEKMAFEAPIPVDFQEILRGIDGDIVIESLSALLGANGVYPVPNSKDSSHKRRTQGEAA